jgi:hypothetical protein
MTGRDVEKLAQMVAFLMKREVGRDAKNYTKNMKLLYWANREALRRWERPITNDATFSMPQGPALSLLLDLMKVRAAPAHQDLWNRYFIKDGYNLQLKADPGSSELSEGERELLAELQDHFKDLDFRQMIAFLHDKTNVPEYVNPGTSSNPIALGEILESLGKDEKQRSVIQDEIAYHKNISSLLEE